jgi:putative aldouronate transport system permease protein
MGWDSILYISAMSSIDPTLYEAAKIDGASRVKQVWHITVPGVLPTAMIMLIMKVGGLFNSNFDLVYGLQNAAWDTDVISTAVYKFGVGQGQYSLATALGLLQGIVALIITMSANKVSKAVSNVSMW